MNDNTLFLLIFLAFVCFVLLAGVGAGIAIVMFLQRRHRPRAPKPKRPAHRRHHSAPVVTYPTVPADVPYEVAERPRREDQYSPEWYETIYDETPPPPPKKARPNVDEIL